MTRISWRNSERWVARAHLPPALRGGANPRFNLLDLHHRPPNFNDLQYKPEGSEMAVWYHDENLLVEVGALDRPQALRGDANPAFQFLKLVPQVAGFQPC